MAKKLKGKTSLKGLRLSAVLAPIAKLIEFCETIGSDARAREFEALDDQPPAKRQAFNDAIYREARRLLRSAKTASGEIVLWLVAPQGDGQARAIPIHGSRSAFTVARALRAGFRAVASRLAAAAEEARNGAEERRIREWWASHPVIAIPLDVFPAPLRDLQLQVRDDGRLYPTMDVFRDVFVAALETAEAWRWRVCPVCDRLYLAKARNAIACDSRCGDAMYMRKYRRARKKRQTRAKEA